MTVPDFVAESSLAFPPWILTTAAEIKAGVAG